EPSLASGFKISNPQRRGCLVASGVYELLAVGRQNRTHRAALSVCDRSKVARLAVKSHDLPDRELGIVGERPGPLGKVAVAAIGRRHGAELVLTRRLRRSTRLLKRRVGRPYLNA